MKRKRLQEYFKGARITLGVVAASWIFLGFVVDIGGPGTGKAQLLIGFSGFVLLGIALADRNARFSPLMLINLGIIYIVCACAEFILSRSPLKPTGRYNLGDYRYMQTADPVTGHRNTPNWTGQFSDGIASGTISINSLGARDDEPVESGKRRVLLVGDSFTFGAVLDQTQTIDKQIERIAPHIDAYNLGVGGYGVPGCIESLKRCELAGTDVIYLFFNNDLRDDNLVPDLGKTVVDGYCVSSVDDHGETLTVAEIRERISAAKAEFEQPPAAPNTSFSVTLPRLRVVLNSIPVGATRERMLLSGGDVSKFSDENVEKALAHTRNLAALAKERNMNFTVVIIPTMNEVHQKRYSKMTRRYVASLRTAGMRAVEPLDQLRDADYWQHDGHFSPGGAAVTAKAIVDALPAQTSE